MAFEFTQFNILEAIFWMSFAGIALYMGSHTRHMPLWYWRIAAGVLFVFGLSDVVELYTPGTFLDVGNEWLLIWKLMCVLDLVTLAVLYVWLRLKR